MALSTKTKTTTVKKTPKPATRKKAPAKKTVAALPQTAPVVTEKKTQSQPQKESVARERDFFACYYNAFQRYFDFKGRTSRYGYWAFVAVNTFVALVTACFVLGGIPFLDTIYSLVVLIPSWAISVRRIHDVNKSGWWVGGTLALAFVVGIMTALMNMSAAEPSKALGIVTAILSVIALAGGLYVLFYSFVKGTKGKNRYGNEPTV